MNADPTDAYGAVTVLGDFTTSGSPVTAITNITGLVMGAPPALGDGGIAGPNGYAGADNVLYATGDYTNNNVSFGGVSFAAGGGSYNIYTWNGGTYLLSSVIDPVGYPQNGTLGTFRVDAVPEPAIWAMMLMGFGGLGAATRTRRNQGRRDRLIVLIDSVQRRRYGRRVGGVFVGPRSTAPAGRSACRQPSPPGPCGCRPGP